MNAIRSQRNCPPQECTANQEPGDHSWVEGDRGPRSRACRTAAEQFRRDVIQGLGGRRKTLPCKYFYDARGSALFEEICSTPEYYITRTEVELLRQTCPQLAMLIGPRAHVIEPGSGAGEKIRLLLDALEQPRSITLIDISESAVAASADLLERDYPRLRVQSLVADFTQPLVLPKRLYDPEGRLTSNSERGRSLGRKVIFFPGSTISNFTPSEAAPFLRGLRQLVSPGDLLLIGVDRVKDARTLERAYDDAAGVTARFNLNLLERIKKELDSDIVPERFCHRALYNDRLHRIEMHLDSRLDQVVRVGGHSFRFREGESIHTENSYKYTPETFHDLAQRAGYDVIQSYSDPAEFFGLYLCQVPPQ